MKKIDDFKSYLMEYNQQVNLVSRRLSITDLGRLISESQQLASYLSGKVIIDAGSGNGLLGIPLAIIFPEKIIHLVETQQKKSRFLICAIDRLELPNVEVHHTNIEEYFHRNRHSSAALVARGFPKNQTLVQLIQKRMISQLALITSLNKAKKIPLNLEKIRHKVYNLPFRENLIILILESVSRGTKSSIKS